MNPDQPGDALTQYLEGWELQIWERMADYTTEEFQARNPDTAKFFADNYGMTTLNSGNILEMDERGESFAVALVHLVFKGWTGDLINKKIKVTMKVEDDEWRIIDPTIFMYRDAAGSNCSKETDDEANSVFGGDAWPGGPFYGLLWIRIQPVFGQVGRRRRQNCKEVNKKILGEDEMAAKMMMAIFSEIKLEVSEESATLVLQTKRIPVNTPSKTTP